MLHSVMMCTNVCRTGIPAVNFSVSGEHLCLIAAVVHLRPRESVGNYRRAVGLRQPYAGIDDLLIGGDVQRAIDVVERNIVKGGLLGNDDGLAAFPAVILQVAQEPLHGEDITDVGRAAVVIIGIDLADKTAVLCTVGAVKVHSRGSVDGG